MACEICKKPYVASSEGDTFDIDGKPHVCNTCGKSFSLKIQLKRHMQNHEDGLPYVCNTCEKQDNQAYNLRLSKKGSFSCETCSETFNSKRLLLRHSCEYALNMMDFEDSDASFEDNIPAKKHLKKYLQTKSKRVHPKNKIQKDIAKTYQCSDCNKSFMQFQTYEKHRQTHKIFKCDSCDAGFTSKEGLHNHHGSDDCKSKGELNGLFDNTDDKKHVCEICCKTFARKSALEGHMVSHLMEKSYSEAEDDSDADADFSCDYRGNELPKELCLPKLKIRRSFSCEVCQKACVSRKRLEKHMSSHYGLTPEPVEKQTIIIAENKKKPLEKKNYACRICNEMFLIKEDYKKHKLTHSSKVLESCKSHDKEKKTYFCKVCSKTFHKKKHLKKHVKMCQNTPIKQNVQTCSPNVEHQESNSIDSNENKKSVERSSTVNKRIKNLNKRIKTFACGVCGKLFAGERCRMKHEAKHSEDGTEDVMTVDKKGKKVKLLVCNFCEEDFTGRRQAFVKHKLSHTPEVCGICDARFVDRLGLREHLKTHIGTEEARRFLECSQKAVHAKNSLHNPEAKVEYIYLVLR